MNLDLLIERARVLNRLLNDPYVRIASPHLISEANAELEQVLDRLDPDSALPERPSERAMRLADRLCYANHPRPDHPFCTRRIDENGQHVGRNAERHINRLGNVWADR